MTSEKLIEAMSLVGSMHDKSTPIKGGKKYTKVVHRVEAFRKFFGLDYGIVTYVSEFASGFLANAQIIVTSTREVVGMGHAWSSSLAKEKSLEKLETTAIGRALASIGLGGDEYASDTEIETFDERYEKPKELTREDKVFQRDLSYELSLCKTVTAVEEFEAENKDLPDFLMDAAAARKTGLKTNVAFPPARYGFIDVEEAVQFGILAKKNIEEGPIDPLEEWMIENDHKLKALDGMLKAKKYNENGTPSQRLFRAYETRTKIAAE